MFKSVFYKKTVSLVLAIVMVASLTVAYAAGTDYETFFKNSVATHRNFATEEQNTVLETVESNYNTIKQKGYNEAPWVNVVLNGESGISPLLTNQIKANEGFIRYIELNFLENKNISITGITDSGLSSRLANFVIANNAIDSQYDLSNLSIKESSSKFRELGNSLTNLYIEFADIESKVTNLGGAIEIKDGATIVQKLADTEIYTEMQIMITNLLKDINGLVFSSQDTYETMYSNLLSSENKKLIGVLFGVSFADALSGDAVTQTITSYLKSSNALSKVVAYQTDLLNGTKVKANDAIYNVVTDLVNGLLDKSEMSALKDAIEDIGWTVDNFVKANKFIGDAADTEFNSRIVNINMFIGRYMGVFKNNTLCTVPVEVDGLISYRDVYDIRLYLDDEPSFSAKIINLVNTNISNADNSISSFVLTEDDNGELEFLIVYGKTGDFKLYVYRSGGTKDVYGYLKVFDVKIENKTIPVTSITISEGSRITLKVGGTQTITVRVLPSNATDKSVTYSSSDTNIVNVDSFGKITGVREGTAVITVKSKDGYVKGQITVDVTKDSSTSGGGSTGAINVNTGGTVTANGISVTANRNSFQAQVQMSVKQTTPPQSMPSGFQLTGSTYNISYTPNVPLLSPLSISIKIDLNNYDPSKQYSIYKYDEATGQWIAYASTVSADKKSITANVDSVGIFTVLSTERSTAVFADLVGHWSENSIMTLYNKGIVTGYSATEFKPDKEITRGEFAVIVYRMLGLSNADGFVYSDSENHWAKDYISAVTAHGFMIGYDDDTFKPDISVSREQIIAVLLRAKYLKLDSSSGIKYTNDELIAKIIEQNPGLSPVGHELSYADANQVSAWADGYVKVAALANTLQGYEDGTIRPLRFGTRAEAMVFAMRILETN